MYEQSATRCAFWLAAHGFACVTAVKGLMRRAHPDEGVEGLERRDYVQSLSGYRGPYVHR